MLSVRLLLLVCFAIASAGPLPSKSKPYVPPKPPTTAAPVKTTATPTGSKSDLIVSIKSRQTQTGKTKGHASVSTTGSTQGSGSNRAVITGHNFVIRKAGEGLAGASVTSASSGDGAFEQGADALTDVISTGLRRAQITTASQGVGATTGKASSVQEVGARADFKGAVKISLGDLNALNIQINKKVGLNSSTGHQASSKGHGTFDISNLAGSDIQRVASVPLPKPQDSLSSDSRLKQAGRTTGAGALSANGTSQGFASANIRTQTPIAKARQAIVANSGTAGGSVSSGKGAFRQDSRSKTELAAIPDGFRATTGTIGSGRTAGRAGSVQRGAANGAARASQAAVVTLPNGGKPVRVVSKQRASGRSSSGLTASTTGVGKFNTASVGGTDIKLKTPDIKQVLPLIPTAPTAPTTEAPKVKKG